MYLEYVIACNSLFWIGLSLPIRKYQNIYLFTKKYLQKGCDVLNTWSDGEISAGGDIHQALVGASRAEGDRSHPCVPGAANSASPAAGGHGPQQQGRAHPDAASVGAADDAATDLGHAAVAHDARLAPAR